MLKIARGLLEFVKRQPVGGVSLAFLLLMGGVALLAPVLSPQDPLSTNILDRVQSPSAAYWLGTDYLGRDTLSRLIYGSRITLLVAIVSILVSTTVGTVWAGVTSYLGGAFDMLSQRVVDTLVAFPTLILALALAAMLGPSVPTVIIAIAVPYTPRACRVARATALSVVQTDYVLSARAIGAPSWYIIARHILPNIFAPVLIIASAQLGGAVLVEASLSFVGMGVPPPSPSWGRELADSAGYWVVSPWLAIFPGAAISVLVMAANLLGDAVRDAFDPRLKRV